MPDFVTSEAQLDAIYGQPAGPAVIKEIDHISEHYRRFIETSPFVILATSGPEGLDCTPRGDPAGFVRVVDSRTVMLPDRRGNNRIDSLRNIVRDPRIALLFLIPGVGRTLRINGRAAISIDRDLCASFTLEGKAPRSVIVVSSRKRLHAVSQGTGSLAIVGRQSAPRRKQPAQQRHDHEVAAAGLRWRNLRPRLPAASQGNHLLNHRPGL